ncbi:MAG: ferritin-like domain-containing protein [Candidatus Bathyarchaeota archaeon]|jgi:bacterioferritin
MLKRNKKEEEGAIDIYKKIIKKSWDKGDHKSHHFFRQIMAEEEDHHDTFTLPPRGNVARKTHFSF